MLGPCRLTKSLLNERDHRAIMQRACVQNLVVVLQTTVCFCAVVAEDQSESRFLQCLAYGHIKGSDLSLADDQSLRTNLV